MSNELAIIESGMIVDDFSYIQNYRLRQATQKIARLTKEAKKSLFEIAVTLLRIQNEKLYEEDGFANIYEYGEKVLQYKKAMTNNLVRIAATYIDKEKLTSILADETGDYSVSQLQELLVLEPDEARVMSQEALIKPTMTTKAIRKAVKEFRSKDDSETDTDVQDKPNDTKQENKYQGAYMDFQIAYSNLKKHLETLEGVDGIQYAHDVLLPSLLDTVLQMNDEREKELNS